MKRLIAKLALALRHRAAIRAYRQASQRTTRLYAENAAIAAELRVALDAEAAAAERMEKAFNPTT